MITFCAFFLFFFTLPLTLALQMFVVCKHEMCAEQCDCHLLYAEARAYAGTIFAVSETILPILGMSEKVQSCRSGTAEGWQNGVMNSGYP